MREKDGEREKEKAKEKTRSNKMGKGKGALPAGQGRGGEALLQDNGKKWARERLTPCLDCLRKKDPGGLAVPGR